VVRGQARQVTGIAQNPQSLLDEFALVAPGQVTAPTQVTVLFDAPGRAASIGPTVVSRQSAAASNPLNPETIVLGLATVGMPLVAALSGRPAPPKGAHRSAVPGVVLMVGAAALLSYGGHATGGGALEVMAGLVALIAGVIMIAPLGLAVLGRLAGPAPVAVRLALRDLARYRARSGPALSAISLGVFIAALVCVLAAQRYRNSLDYAGPNLASNQVVVYTVQGGQDGGPGSPG
jgi:hypothetical protein